MNSKTYSHTSPNPLMKRATAVIKGTATFDEQVFRDHRELEEFLLILRSMGCCIVFTTGVWDVLHYGHADYIELGKNEARNIFPESHHLVMVVGVDTDELTRKRKGPKRPLVPEDERLRILRHIRAVDVLVLQYELNQLYSVVRPDVLILSSTTKDLPNDKKFLEPLCGKFCFLPPQAETSTTARIRKIHIEGVDMVGQGVTQVLENYNKASSELQVRLQNDLKEVVQRATEADV